MNNRVLAIIPARSGSKGLKDKNIKELNGKHLIGYTIEAAISSKIFDKVIVSTDSENYSEIAKLYGAEIPFLRPEHLSNDRATTEEVIIYTIDKLKELGEEFDEFVLLQPTSPLRSSEDIQNAYKIFNEKDASSVVSVCEVEHSPKLMNTLQENLSLDGFIKKDNNKRRQDLDKYYRLNGAIYISKCDNYKETRNFYGKNSYAYIMDIDNSIDIDSIRDFKYTEFLIEYKKTLK